MKENFQEVKWQISDLISASYLPVIYNEIQQQRNFIDNFKTHLIELEALAVSTKEENVRLNEIVAVNEKITKLLNEQFVKKEVVSFAHRFPEFASALDKIIIDSDESVIEFQEDEKFIVSKNDPPIFRVLKPAKKIFLTISNIPISVNNLVRKILKKSVKNNRKWKRIVPVKKLRKYYLENLLSIKLIDLQRKAYSKFSQTQKIIKDLYESSDLGLEKIIFNNISDENQTIAKNISKEINDLQTHLTDLEESLTIDFKPLLDDAVTEYQMAFSKAGTIEFPKYNLRKGEFKKISRQLKHIYLRTNSGWENNLSALGDALKLNNWVYLIKYKNKLELNSTINNFKKTIDEKFIPNSKKISDVVAKAKDLIVDSNTRDELLKAFELIKIEIKKRLTGDLIPNISNLLIEENTSSLIPDFKSKITNHLNIIANECILVKTDEYDKEIKDSEISLISPKELLEFFAIPKLFGSTEKLKAHVSLEIQKIQNIFGEIDHISDFTIDSSANLLKTDVQNIQGSKQVAVEGLERVLKKLSGVDNIFEQLNQVFSNELKTSVNIFQSDLKNLTLTEKLFDIKLRLAKAKAIEKSKLFRQKVKIKIKKLLPHVLWYIRNYYHKTVNLFQKLRKILGFAPKTKIISSEISNYLAETYTAIQRLPFIYQRLFEIKPLEDQRFYFGRDLEMKEIQKAFDNWQTGKFAPVAIIGEKGSGSTTLINFFTANISSDFRVIRGSLNYPCFESNDFLSTLGGILGEKTFNSHEDVIEHLNNLESKQVVILENLQRLFSRKVNGFGSLKNLFEIISRTNKKVFWLTTSTLYCWTYLDKTIHAPDYFGYNIYLRKLNDDQITNLVSKRHRVSGYNIEYEADESTLKSKSYKKLSDNKKQQFLIKKYFKELNEFAQSNITLALLFWLRSAKEIIDDKIIIGSPEKLDYSFLENLSNDKIFILHAMLIHDGLREKDSSAIFNFPINQSRMLLLLLYDDGIIVKQDDMYLINPLLYRQIVGLLKAKNIIN